MPELPCEVVPKGNDWQAHGTPLGSNQESDGIRPGRGPTQVNGHPRREEPVGNTEGVAGKWGVPGTLGPLLSPLHMLRASINETLMKQLPSLTPQQRQH